MKEPGFETIGIRKWTIHTLYGWMIGFVLVIVVSIATDSFGLGDFQFFLGICMAIGVGFMQNRLLTKHLDWDRTWLWTMIAGLGISFLFFDLADRIFEDGISYNLIGAVLLSGLLIGLFQIYFLRNKGLGPLWIIINILAWVAAASMVYLADNIDDILPRHPLTVIPYLLIIIGFASVLLGLITGIGLRKMITKGNN